MRLRSLVIVLQVGLAAAGLLATPVATGAGAVETGAAAKRVALVIGNGTYEGTRTTLASVDDALLVGKTFAGLAFTKVTVSIDLSRDRFEATLRDFAGEAAGADWAVIYYAGGALSVENANYLIPIDTRPSVDLDIATAAVDLDRAVQAVAGAKTLRLVMLDTARGSSAMARLPKASSTRLISDALAPLPRNDALLLYVSQRDHVTGDDRDRGALAQALLDNLRRPRLTLRELVHRLEADIGEQSHRGQELKTVGALPIAEIVLRDQGHGPNTDDTVSKGEGSRTSPGSRQPSGCLEFSGEKAC